MNEHRAAAPDRTGRQYADLFATARQTICSHAAPVLNAPRQAAYERFAAEGFPSRKAERYKYTDLAQLFAPDYGLNLNRLHIPVNPYDAFRCDVPNLSTSLFFVVNDAFYKPAAQAAHASIGGARNAALPEGVVVASLNDYAAAHPDFAEAYYNRLAAADDAPETLLNTMLAQDGLLVYVPRGVAADRAIQVINILRSDVDLMVNRRVLIVVEEQAQVKLLFCDHAADDRHFLATQVIEVFLGEGAQADLYCLEETHVKCTRVSTVYVRQEAQSRLRHHVVTLHNGTTRNTLRVDLQGEGASCECNGCVIADKQQYADNNTLITHHVGHCTSSELYKYVLNDEATGAFAGRVLVAQGANQTASQMTNQNLCATPQARMFTQPMLEIYADDVKCAHGSTVGQLNDAALFYMRQRGISEAEARTLLQQAFVNQVTDLIDLAPLRDRLHHLVEKRFRGELSKCEGCRLCR